MKKAMVNDNYYYAGKENNTMRELLRLFTIGIFTAACMVNVSFTQDANSKMLKLVPEIHKAVDADAKGVQDIYKDIHEHAELGFMETRTAGIVAKELKDLGFDVKTGIGITGVVGILKNGDGPVFMFRGDMDALPIEEKPITDSFKLESVFEPWCAEDGTAAERGAEGVEDDGGEYCEGNVTIFRVPGGSVEGHRKIDSNNHSKILTGCRQEAETSQHIKKYRA